MAGLLADNGAKVVVGFKKNRYGRTPRLIAEGLRPDNFNPSAETIEAVITSLRATGVVPPPPTPRPGIDPVGYEDSEVGT
jgi:uncharacterized protein